MQQPAASSVLGSGAIGESVVFLGPTEACHAGSRLLRTLRASLSSHGIWMRKLASHQPHRTDPYSVKCSVGALVADRRRAICRSPLIGQCDPASSFSISKAAGLRQRRPSTVCWGCLTLMIGCLSGAPSHLCSVHSKACDWLTEQQVRVRLRGVSTIMCLIQYCNNHGTTHREGITCAIAAYLN